MATTEELFISVDSSIYRDAKSATLMSQAELLKTLRHLQNLKVLSRRKSDLKEKLYKLLSSAAKKIETLQEKMPTSDIPKTITIHEEKKEKAPKQKKTFAKTDEIEEELKEIKEKLRQLNS